MGLFLLFYSFSCVSAYCNSFVSVRIAFIVSKVRSSLEQFCGVSLKMARRKPKHVGQVKN
jgi:hypothetical protein